MGHLGLRSATNGAATTARSLSRYRTCTGYTYTYLALAHHLTRKADGVCRTHIKVLARCWSTSMVVVDS